MTQNLITLTMTPDELTAIDAAIEQLETRLHGLVDLTTAQRRSAPKMGLKSEQFARQALQTMELNPKVVPEGVDLADAKADLLTLDQMRPRFERLQRLAKRASDSEMALGSDVMATALEGYSLIKAIGRKHGLEDARKVLAGRFGKGPRQEAEAEAEPETTPQSAAA